MAAIDRPYKEALTKAIDIYREEMRAFLTRCLRRISRTKCKRSDKAGSERPTDQ